MKRCPRGLADLALAHLLDEQRSTLRHSIRNKLGGARNAAFYLKKKLVPADAPPDDPRVLQFFDIINQAIGETVALLDAPPIPQAAATSAAAPGPVVLELVQATSLPPGVTLRVEGEAPQAAIDAQELELAVFFLIDAAVEAAEVRGGGEVLVELGRAGERVTIAVSHDGDTAGALEGELRPGGARVARRVLARWGGEVDLEAKAGRARAVLRLRVAVPA